LYLLQASTLVTMVQASGNGVNNGHVGPQTSTATKLRQMIQTSDFIIAPGVYEGFSARIAHEVGFDCIYMASTQCSSESKRDQS